MNYPGPYSDRRTAFEIEAANPGVQFAVIPLTDVITPDPDGRDATLILETSERRDSIKFDNHPYCRCTEFDEPIWFCDHAGRWKAGGATHVAVQVGTRLAAMVQGADTRHGFCFAY